jgi:hypothetical protein
MKPLTVYVEFTGGRWEARYWHTDEARYFRFTGLTDLEALAKAIRETGYTHRECKVVRP